MPAPARCMSRAITRRSVVSRDRRSTAGVTTTSPGALGRVTTVSADDVRIANPAGFPTEGDFARIARLSVQADVMAYIQSREIVLPQIVMERPEVQALQTA